MFLRSTPCRSWDELKTALLAEFHYHASATDVHNMLWRRKKRKEETFQQYLLSMQEIASQAYIDEQDVISYVIRGIPDSIYNKQVLLTANKIAELKVISRKLEKMKYEPQTSISAQHKITSNQKNIPSLSSKFTTKCFNCNEAGHISPNCSKPRRKKGSCYRCGQKGHVVKDCPQSSSILVVQDPELQKEKQLFSCSYMGDFYDVFEYGFQEDDAGPVRMTMHAMILIDTGSPISFVQQRYVPPFLMTSVPTLWLWDFVGYIP